MNRQTSPKPSNCSPTIESIQFAHSGQNDSQPLDAFLFIHVIGPSLYETFRLPPSCWIRSSSSCQNLGHSFSLTLSDTNFALLSGERASEMQKKKERKNKIYIDSRDPSGNWCKYSSCHMNICENFIDSLITPSRWTYRIFQSDPPLKNSRSLF